MKTKLLLSLSLLIGANSFAENICSNNDKCKTAGIGVGVATGSGIYSAMKYSKSDSIEKQFTVKLFSHGEDQMRMEVAVRRMADGDKITILHQLSEADNRQYHIDLMESEASSARSRAATYGALALTATKTVTEPGPNNTTIFRTEPDYAARTSYALMATHALAEASDYSAKANDARHGGHVPTYTLEHVVGEKAGTQSLAGSFIEEKVARGGKIMTVSLLPRDKFILVKSAINKGRIGLAGVALGVAFAAEEMMNGYVADKINSVDSDVQISDY
jgi:hypothetical protein